MIIQQWPLYYHFYNHVRHCPVT